MADERDPDISRKYREVGAEEPPRALDEKILAASRRAIRGEMAAHPAPLVAPAGRRRWYFPVAAAAVIVLAVTVTIQMERQRPEDEVVASAPAQERKEEVPSAAATAEQPKPAQKPARAPQAFTPEPPSAAPAPSTQSAEVPRELAKSNEQAAAVQGNRTEERQVPTDSARDSVAESPRPQAGAVARGDVRMRAESKLEAPEAWLERIAALRKQGKQDEADTALADFRKHYPDYRISDETRAKVERK
jgi:hypothetical protein